MDRVQAEEAIKKIRAGMEPFGVKLKKIKIETTIKKKTQVETPKQKSIKELQDMFSGKHDHNAVVIDRKVTEVREEIKEEEREARVTEVAVAVEGFVQ